MWIRLAAFAVRLKPLFQSAERDSMVISKH